MTSILERAEGLLTPQELAQKLRVTRRTIYKWIDNGWIPEPVTIGARLFFDPAVVDSALAKTREDRAAARAERREAKSARVDA